MRWATEPNGASGSSSRLSSCDWVTSTTAAGRRRAVAWPRRAPGARPRGDRRHKVLRAVHELTAAPAKTRGGQDSACVLKARCERVIQNSIALCTRTASVSPRSLSTSLSRHTLAGLLHTRYDSSTPHSLSVSPQRFSTQGHTAVLAHTRTAVDYTHKRSHSPRRCHR